MRAPWGQEEGGRKSTATKGEVSVGRWLWGRCSPCGGASATLTCPNLSSPGRAVINYWAAHTRDELGFIECHTPDLGNKSLDSKQTHWWGGCLQTANAWVTAVSGTWRRVNQEMNKPPLMNKQQLHGPFLKLTITATWRQAQSQIDGRFFFTVGYKAFTLKVKASAITRTCASVVLWEGWQFSLWGIHALLRGEKKALINNSFSLLLCFVCIYCTEAGHSSCRKPSLCLWREEEKVNTAKIKMDLRLGGPSNTVQ